MVTLKIEDLKNIINKSGYHSYFENIELESELLDNLSVYFGRPLINRLSLASKSIEPFNHYLDSLLDKADKLKRLSSQETTVSNMNELFQVLDVSESLKYMFSEGLEKQIQEIEKVYNDFLELIQSKVPEIDFQKRYPFTQEMKNFCKVYLAKPIKPFAETMIIHQEQLTETYNLYKNHLKNKNELQSSYLISKIAGIFLGGIFGSIAVTALFEGIQSSGIRKFSESLNISHQTWYQIQTANITDTIVSNYQPKLYHLYLSIVGGLVLNIKKDLEVLGIDLFEFNVPGNRLELDLTEKAEEAYKGLLENILNKNTDLKEITDTINLFSKRPYLQELVDENNFLYIEKLIVKYLSTVSDEVANSGSFQLDKYSLLSINLRNHKGEGELKFLEDEDRLRSGFIFLNTKNYVDVYNSLESTFTKFPDEMVKVYESIVEKFNLFTWGDKNAVLKVLDDNPISRLFVIANLVINKNPNFSIENRSEFNEAVLLPFLEKNQNTDFRLDWLIPKANDTILSRFKIKINSRKKLESAIMNFDYFLTEELLKQGLTLKEFFVPKEILQAEYRGFFEMLSHYLNNIKVIVDESILLDIIEKEDEEALRILLTLGLDPFTPLKDSYLLGQVTVSGTFLMNLYIYEQCNSNIVEFKNSLRNLNSTYLTPYYLIFASGRTFINQVYPELLSTLPIERVNHELTAVSSSFPSDLLWEMYEVVDSKELFTYANSKKESFYENLCSTNHYVFFNNLFNIDPSFLKGKINNKFILKEVSELGNIDLALHFTEVFEIYTLGEISYEEIEVTAVYELNEMYLRILLYLVEGVEEVLTDIKNEADNANQIVVSRLIDKVIT